MKIPPLIAILGRPNVGKSTLFNRLLSRREAIVEDRPGVTRDRHYSQGTIGRKSFRLVDTGGILFGDDHPLGESIRKQALFALEEADAVIYVMDGREGYLPVDADVIGRIRRSGKPSVFAVNKVDTVKTEEVLADFHRHGVAPLIGISAAHGRNVDALLDPFLDLMPDTEDAFPVDPGIRFSEASESDLQAWLQRRIADPPRVAVIGRPNVGKSTLVNRLLGEERLVTSPIPGTTRDAIDTLVTFRDKTYHFVDTAGLRKKGKVAEASELYAQIRTDRAILESEIAVVLLSAEDGLTDGDLRIIRQVIDHRRGLILAWNKWDTLKSSGPSQAPPFRDVRERYPFLSFAPMFGCSARTGFHVSQLFGHIATVRDWYFTRITTSELNNLLLPIVQASPPPRLKNYPVRIFYVTQVQIAPTVIMAFSNKPEGISLQYRQFLSRKIREKYPFVGVPFLLKVQAKSRKDRERDGK
ncbi:GTP-binding protein EngA [Leptospirillum ferriphilum]|uniref:GTPase Der n=1 Tax=Leptospirillum ferriphilum TaxID=178606 RepID=A0A094W9B2_9BACT|nr:ribosome biogenesis GTPase Der [Leptospirillum ferriphilum]KGA94103.1 GTP-binding protein EngA [Leptospirillum ferriphilum]